MSSVSEDYLRLVVRLQPHGVVALRVVAVVGGVAPAFDRLLHLSDFGLELCHPEQHKKALLQRRALGELSPNAQSLGQHAPEGGHEEPVGCFQELVGPKHLADSGLGLENRVLKRLQEGGLSERGLPGY